MPPVDSFSNYDAAVFFSVLASRDFLRSAKLECTTFFFAALSSREYTFVSVAFASVVSFAVINVLNFLIVFLRSRFTRVFLWRLFLSARILLTADLLLGIVNSPIVITGAVDC